MFKKLKKIIVTINFTVALRIRYPKIRAWTLKHNINLSNVVIRVTHICSYFYGLSSGAKYIQIINEIEPCHLIQIGEKIVKSNEENGRKISYIPNTKKGSMGSLE